jgi:type I restriction enzyme S subunit
MKQTAYKESGVRWLGRVPADWGVTKIKRHCLVKRGASPRPIDDQKYFSDTGDYAWVRISDVTASDKYLLTSEQRLSELGASLSVKREPGDIFVSICASVGKPVITRIKCCIHDGFVWFDRLKLEPEYLFYLFVSGEMFKGLGNWGTQLNLNTDIIAEIEIPIPTLAEQRRIACYLDEATGKVDRLVALRRRQMELLREQRAALIQQAVTRGLNPNAPLKDSGLPWLGQIPKHWEVTRLKHVASVLQTGSTPPSSNADYFCESDTGLPWFAPADIATDGLFVMSPSKWVSPLSIRDGVVTVLAAPVILIVGIGTVGKIGVSIGDCATNQQINAVQLKPSHSTEYFAHQLSSFGTIMASRANCSLIPILNQTQTGNFPLVAPPPDEQKEILDFIQKENARFDRLLSTYTRQLELLTEYRAALIHECVTGQRAVPTN